MAIDIHPENQKIFLKYESKGLILKETFWPSAGL